MGAGLSPFCVGLMAGLPGLASHGSSCPSGELAANNRNSWMPPVPIIHLTRQVFYSVEHLVCMYSAACSVTSQIKVAKSLVLVEVMDFSRLI